VAGFYRGLGMSVDAATTTIRRRELSIAQQLVEAGATAAEAEAYARDVRAIPGRIAPVDLRSYERERLSWLARSGRAGGGVPHLVDRTGHGPHGSEAASPPPRRHTDASEIARPGGRTTAEQPHSADIGSVARALFGGSS
jgi:hypothetical protein